MKIVTLNTWGKNGPCEKRFCLISRELKKLNADIVSLQEVFKPELNNQIKKVCGFKYSCECYPAGLVLLSRCPIKQTKTHTYRTISPNEKNDRRVIFVRIKAKGKFLWVAN